MKVQRYSLGVSRLLTSLILIRLLLPPSAHASVYNRYPWPAAYIGLQEEKDNTSFLDAAHPCFRTRGRSFQVTHQESFKLSGLAVYVFVPNNNQARFDRNFFRLSLATTNNPASPAGGQPPTTNISPTHSAIVGLESGQPTFEVYFPLNLNLAGGVIHTAILECLTDEPDLLRVAESSRVADGLTQYYDSTNAQTLSYYMNGRKVLFTTFAERNTPHFPSIAKLPESTDKTPGVTSPKFHPVIFVHGLGGSPENFASDAENRNYVKLLTDLGYAKDFVHLYSYGYKEDGQGRRYYNYQGDVREIAQGLEVVVNALSDKHKAQGGDGKVDVVGHSLGNLVTRQYLYTHQTNHKIRRFIAVGAPFKGAWFMSIDKNVRSIPAVGKNIEKIIADAVMNLHNKDAVGKISKDSIASVQGTPGSDFLEGTNGINKTKIRGLELYTIYGDVKTTLRQKVFSKTFEKKLSLGDGLILPSSANFSDWVETNSSGQFAYTGNMLVDVKFSRDQGALAAEIKMDDPRAAQSLHSELLTRKDSQGKILCLLKENDIHKC